MFRYFFSFILILFLGGCVFFMDPPTGELSVLNYTDSAVYVYTTCSDSLPFEYGLKLFVNYGSRGIDECGNKMRGIISPNYRVNAYSWGIFNDFGRPKKKQTGCKDNILKLYFITEATMRNKSWEEIYKSQLYKRKMVFTQEQLDSLCWRVVYEPEKK